MPVLLHNSPIETPAPVLTRSLDLTIQLHLEACLSWTPSQPNAAPLWAAIRTAASGYMMSLFQKGTLAGTTPSQAFFLRCDQTTTTQLDIDNSIANLLVGFAPTKPSEFTLLRLSLHTAPPNPFL